MGLNINNIFNDFEVNLTELEKLAIDYMEAGAVWPVTKASEVETANKKIEFDLKVSQISQVFKNYLIDFHEIFKQKTAEGLTIDEEDSFFKEYRMCSSIKNSLSYFQNRLEVIKCWSNISFFKDGLDEGKHIKFLNKIQEFIQRGGQFYNIPPEGDNLAIIFKSDTNIPACQQGWNRSQTLRAILEQEGVKVKHLIAGGCGIFPYPDVFPVNKFFFSPMSLKEDKDGNYEKCFGMPRMQQEDFEFNMAFGFRDDPWYKQFYEQENIKLQEKLFNRLEGKVHFLTFYHPTIVPFITRIMQTELGKVGEKEKIDLSRYTITFFDWPDSINYPSKGIESGSLEAYMDLASQLRSRLVIINS